MASVSCGFWEICGDGSAGGPGANLILGTYALYDWIGGTDKAVEYYAASRASNTSTQENAQHDAHIQRYNEYLRLQQAAQNAVDNGAYRQAYEQTKEQVVDLASDVKTLLYIVGGIAALALIARIAGK